MHTKESAKSGNHRKWPTVQTGARGKKCSRMRKKLKIWCWVLIGEWNFLNCARSNSSITVIEGHGIHAHMAHITVWLMLDFYGYLLLEIIDIGLRAVQGSFHYGKAKSCFFGKLPEYSQLKASRFLRRRRPTMLSRFPARTERTTDRREGACGRAARGCSHCWRRRNKTLKFWFTQANGIWQIQILSKLNIPMTISNSHWLIDDRILINNKDFNAIMASWVLPRSSSPPELIASSSS